MNDETFICEECHNEIDSFYLYYDFNGEYNRNVCENCFNNIFYKNAKLKNKQWFLDNFNDPIKEFPKLKFLKNKT